MEEHYYIEKESCPDWCLCGGQGPLILLSCDACGAIIACCGEVDHYIGVYTAPLSHAIERTPPERSIMDYSCPACGQNLPPPRYATKSELKAFGFTPAMLRGYVGAPEYFTECEDW
jgi:hypothetical protein